MFSSKCSLIKKKKKDFQSPHTNMKAILYTDSSTTHTEDSPYSGNYTLIKF